ELAGLVGPEDAQVQRWRRKLSRVAALQERLQPVAEVAPLPADADAALTELTELVGTGSAQLQAWRAKIERVLTLKVTLSSLDRHYVLPEDASALSQELVDLVSPADREAAQAAERVAILTGPSQPSWAASMTRDAFGLVAVHQSDEVRFRFRYIPAGADLIGSPDDAAMREADERQVPVRLSRSFWLLENELTQEQWQLLMRSSPSRFRGRELPVERISWRQAQEACRRLADMLAGPSVRLPSEMEWEYACRVGHAGEWIADQGALDIERLGELAVHGRSGGPQIVAQRLPNPLGLYDMHGNVWEWCQDAYGPYPATEASDWIGRQGELQSARGGSWADQPAMLRAANRVGLDPGMRTMFVGMRPLVEITGDAVQLSRQE
ncbi:MAG: SUMF1/EgtB/PvdO family nonheme iron enzyme, partial [Planctomycetota bacterium]